MQLSNRVPLKAICKLCPGDDLMVLANKIMSIMHVGAICVR